MTGGIWRWYTETIIRTLAKVTKELHEAYQSTTNAQERDQLKGGMASLSLILETAMHDYKKLLDHEKAAGSEERNFLEETFFGEN